MTAPAEQSSFTLPSVQVKPPQLVVTRAMAGLPPAEVIDVITLSQQIVVSDGTGNPATSAFSTFTWAWQCPASSPTNDLDTALAQAGWDAALPSLDPSKSYSITVTAL
jgi:hypothetical protein